MHRQTTKIDRKAMLSIIPVPHRGAGINDYFLKRVSNPEDRRRVQVNTIIAVTQRCAESRRGTQRIFLCGDVTFLCTFTQKVILPFPKLNIIIQK